MFRRMSNNKIFCKTKCCKIQRLRIGCSSNVFCLPRDLTFFIIQKINYGLSDIDNIITVSRPTDFTNIKQDTEGWIIFYNV